jgi:mgtE-like transporter
MLSRQDFREILTSELISVTGGLFAGFLLALFTDQLLLIPGIFILIPGFLEMRGNISGSLSARLGSGLWVGALRPQLRKNRVLHGNLLASAVLVLAVSLVLGAVAYAASLLFFGINAPQLLAVALLAGIISNVIEIPLTAATTFWLFRRGHDPANIMGPYVTTTGDIISIVSLVAAIGIVGVL